MSFGHGLKVADATLEQLIGAVTKTMTSRNLPSAGQKCSGTDSVLVQAVRTSIPVGDGEEDSRPGAREIWVIGASTPAQSGSAHRSTESAGLRSGSQRQRASRGWSTASSDGTSENAGRCISRSEERRAGKEG